MHCPDLQELRALLEGELPSNRAPAVNAHVDGCSQCQGTLETLTELPAEVSVSAQSSLSADDPSVSSLLSRLRDASSINGDHGFLWEQEAAAAIASLQQFTGVEPLAHGGSGMLFRATDTETGREVAIKIWPRRNLGRGDLAERVRREALALSRLNHPHIVKILDVGVCEDQSAFITMELIDGDTLRTLLRRGHAIPAHRAATMVHEIASALACVHDAGLVHRDVKPSNILVERSTSATKLVDFGLVLDHDAERQLTQDGAIAGTPQYMSPEQIRDPHHVDARSDIYSLGIVLYELLTGSRPYRGVMRMVMFKVLNEDPAAPRKFDDTIPRELETICLKAISKERHLRYATASEFADELKRWLDQRPILTRRPSWWDQVWRWGRRNQRQAGLVAAITTLLAVLAIGGPLASFQIAGARDEAQRQEQQASKQRDIALDTIEQMVFEVSDRFDSDFSQSSHAQEGLLLTAIGGLDQIASSSRETPNEEGQFAIQRAFAGAHVRMAGLMLQKRGRNGEAREHLEKAQGYLPGLINKDPGDFQVLTSESYASWYEYRLLEREAEARQQEHVEREAAAGGDDVAQREDAGEAAKATTRNDDNQHPDAENDEELSKQVSLLQHSIATDEKRMQLKPDDESVMHDLTVSYEALAELGQASDLELTESTANRGLVIALRMQAAHPDVCADDHASKLLLINAQVMFQRGELEAALELARQVEERLVSGAEHYIESDELEESEVIYAPNSKLIVDTYGLLSDIGLQFGDREMAHAAAAQGIELLDRLEAEDQEWRASQTAWKARMAQTLEDRLDELEAAPSSRSGV
ncbi:MAG: serine/threonine-protein kinase [Planctomycetota bacterium]